MATQITNGLIEAVRQHGQLAAMTQGTGGAARTATMLATVGFLETGETLERGRRGAVGSGKQLKEGEGCFNVSEHLEMKAAGGNSVSHSVYDVFK